MSLAHSADGKQNATAGNTAVVTKLVLKDGSTVVVTFAGVTWGTPGSNGEATANSITQQQAVADGTVDTLEAQETDGTVIWTDNVGKSGTDNHAITGVNQGNHTFTVAADLSALTRGSQIHVNGSTGNDGAYSIVSVSGSGPTTITVLETVADATVDGKLTAYGCLLDNTNIATTAN
jgi:hypothetical protein